MDFTNGFSSRKPAKASSRTVSQHSQQPSSAPKVNGHRQFSGPAEKRQHYISQFIARLESLQWSPTELLQIQELLRKELSTNPQLFKLIQTVVDDCVFLDDDVLQVAHTDSINPVENYSDDLIKQMQQKVAQQSWLNNLAKFNYDRVQAMMKSTTGHDDTRHRQQQKQKQKQKQQEYENGALFTRSSTAVEKNAIQSSIITIAKHVADLDQVMSQHETLFKDKLIDTDQMVSLSLFADQNDAQSLGALFEGETACKTRFIIFKSLLDDLSHFLIRLEQRIVAYKAREKLETHLKQIRNRQDELLFQMAGKNTSSSSSASASDLKALVPFVRNNLSDLDPRPFFDKLYRLHKSIILIENEMKCKK